MTQFLPPAIEQRCDVIRSGAGEIEQVINHPMYRFGGAASVQARAFLDEPGKVSILSGGAGPEPVLDYLRERFGRIDQLESSGYRTIRPA